MALLRKLDHLAIYLLIAGTYTPICLFYLPGAWRTALLATIWVLAAAGMAVKLFIIKAPRWITAGVYLVMGWLGVVAIGEVLGHAPVGMLLWLLAGGLFFSVGAAIYITKRPDPYPGRFGFHEIWHIFVVLGAFSHFVIMAAYIAPLG
jgi:hemolysin III